MNQCVFMGNLTRDPVLTVTKTDKHVVNFGIAVNNRKGKDGAPDEVAFIECEAWDTGGDLINEYFQKGDPIIIVCTARTETWEKDGEKRSRLKHRVDKFHFIPGRKDKAAKVDKTEESAKTDDGKGNIPF